MKTTSLLISIGIALSGIHSLNAQPAGVDVQLSQEYEEPRNSTVNDVIGFDANGFFVTRTLQKYTHYNISIEKYGNDLHLIGGREMEGQAGKDDIAFVGGFMVGANIYSYGQTYEKDTKTLTLYTQHIDNETVSMQGNPEEILTITDPANKSESIFENELSPSKNLVALYYIPGHANKYLGLLGRTVTDKGHSEETDNCVIGCFNADMSPVWTKNIALPHSNKLYDPVSVRLDDQGNVYLLGRLFKDGTREKKGGLPNYTYIITTFTNEGNESHEYTVALGDKFITDCEIRLSEKNKLLCTGFYSDHGTISIKGVFVMTLDNESGTASQVGSKEFDKDFLSLFESDSKAAKGNELYKYDLSDFVIRPDGGALLIAEKFFISETMRTDPQTHQTYYTYYYNYDDIIVVNIDPDYVINWAVGIPKIQISSIPWYLSFAYYLKGDEICLLFNDNAKNLDQEHPDKIYSFDGKNSVAVIVTIDSEGKWKKEALFSNKDEGIILRPTVAEQINDNDLIIYCDKGKKYKMGKISFE